MPALPHDEREGDVLMAGLKDLVRAVQDDLPITVRHERWMLANVDPTYSEEAIAFSDDFLRGKVGGKRAGRARRFRASGMGKCARKRVFERIGHPGISEDYSSAMANVFATGNFMHRKWQMAGLTEGWLVAAEVPLENTEMDLGGTADGFIWDGSLFELKTINDRGYSWVTRQRDPNHEHKKQTAAYKLLKPELTKASIVYENKNTGEWREYRVEFTDELMQEVVDELDELRHAVEHKVLPEPLSKCQIKEGTEYRRCPFRETCLALYDADKHWPRRAA